MCLQGLGRKRAGLLCSLGPKTVSDSRPKASHVGWLRMGIFGPNWFIFRMFI